MEIQALAESAAHVNNTLETWNRSRTSEELQNFIETHHDMRLDEIVLE